MNRRQFRDYSDLMDEADKLVEDDRDDSEDRATISAFYNGMETMGEEEAKRRGVTELTNHLFGYDSISASKEQIASTFTKSPTTWVIECDGPDEARRQKWSMAVTKHLNDAINASRRFKPVHESVSGDGTLYGSAFYCNFDPFDWCPKAMRPLVPRETGILAGDVPYACIPDRVFLSDLYRWKQVAKRQNERGIPTAWNLKGINDAIEFLEGNTGTKASATNSSSTASTDRKSVV